jgi:hypothetical protein
MAVPTEIAEGIAAIIVATSSLNGLDMVFVGIPYAVQNQYDQYAVVVVDSEITEERLTGNKVFRTYTGGIVINVRLQDTLTAVGVTGRINRMGGYATVNTLVDAAVKLFKTTANRRLGGLSVTGGAVDNFEVGEPGIEYGVSATDERETSYLHFGAIPFSCRTLETIS